MLGRELVTSDGIDKVKRNVTEVGCKRTPETFASFVTARKQTKKNNQVKIIVSQRAKAAGSLDELNSRVGQALFSKLDIA